jgi:hypothetical protein
MVGRSGPRRIYFLKIMVDMISMINVISIIKLKWFAGLGDIAVPGLLACLAFRYDASRLPDMGARAVKRKIS